jgi:preprotein translocase subunit SecY
MPSAAEQLASNLNFRVFSKADELKKRIWFTLAALLFFRLGTYIPLPGINPDALSDAFARQSQGVLGLLNMFSGGAVERMAIFALGITPYISASIIIQLMTSIVPSLDQLKKDGEHGRKIINQYTRYFTVFLGCIQAYGISVGLEGSAGIVTDPGLFFRLSTIISLIGGTMLLLWIGEQITARGIGNGTSLIIFVGIVANLPNALVKTLELGRTNVLSPFMTLVIFVMILILIAFIVFVERSQRKLLIQYPKRQVGNKTFQGDSSHLPLKLNTAGVIPPIFASSLLLLPATAAGFSTSTSLPSWFTFILSSLSHGQPFYMILYGSLIVFFAFFYTAIVFNSKETAEQLKKNSGFILGIRPGERTAEHIDYVLTRITVIGALYIATVCLVPEVLISTTGIPFYLGGTSLLIVVTVTLETVSQIQGHLIAHQYEGLLRKTKLRGSKKNK